MSALLECEGLDIAVDGRDLVRNLSITLGSGARVAVLGCNGVGKTLTLHTLAGLRPHTVGAIRLRGENPAALPRRDIALRLGLLLQSQEDPFPSTVLETALIGRHARLGLWQWETDADLARAREALRAMDLDGLEARPSGSLSGGERRRLALATLLVQDPDVLLLDEPLNHLDPLHQFAVLDTLTALAAGGKAVVACLHDPSLAARYFEHVLLLHGDGRWQLGPADELLNPQALEELYHVPFTRYFGGAGPVLLASPGTSPASAPARLTLAKPRR